MRFQSNGGKRKASASNTFFPSHLPLALRARLSLASVRLMKRKNITSVVQAGSGHFKSSRFFYLISERKIRQKMTQNSLWLRGSARYSLASFFFFSLSLSRFALLSLVFEARLGVKSPHAIYVISIFKLHVLFCGLCDALLFFFLCVSFSGPESSTS